MDALIMTVLFSIQLGLFLSILLYVYLLAKWVLSGKADAPFVPTPIRYAPVVLEVLEVQPGDIVYELGSGDGRFVLACAALAPDAQFVGIERNPLLYVVSLVRKRSGGNPANAEFRRENFFKTDLSNANKMYLYLLDNVMHRLQPKFEREFKGRVASRAFPFSRKEMSDAVMLTERIGAHGQHLLFMYDF